ncbi:MAG: hypothetical protein RRB13_10260 [bacterium]|nr:hypothetical protein [bacterium]
MILKKGKRWVFESSKKQQPKDAAKDPKENRSVSGSVGGVAPHR